MVPFIQEHWWGMSLVVAATLFALFRLRHRIRYQTPSNARSFAAVRVLTPQELTRHFGTYLPEQSDLLGAVFVPVWFTALAAIVAFSFDLSAPAIVGVALVAATIGTGVVVLDSRSKRVLGPETIAFVSPLAALSWSVPIDSIIQCELVPGRPHSRLRVHAAGRSFSLPLTREMWIRLAPAA